MTAEKHSKKRFTRQDKELFKMQAKYGSHDCKPIMGNICVVCEEFNAYMENIVGHDPEESYV